MTCWNIVGIYRGEREVVDTFDTPSEARRMLAEYRMAFGSDWSLTIKRGRRNICRLVAVNGENS